MITINSRKEATIIRVDFIPCPLKANDKAIKLIKKYNTGDYLTEPLYLVVFEKMRCRSVKDIIEYGFYDYASTNKDLVQMCNELSAAASPIIPEMDMVTILA